MRRGDQALTRRNTLYYNGAMRTIINISLPSELNKVVEREVKKGKFSTKSEFFRMLLRLWEEEKIAQELEASVREMRAGKKKLLRSLADLD